MARQLFSQEGCSPYKVAILPWVQLPLWIALSFALRDMTGVFPNKVPLNPEATVSFASEGALWFTDLTLPDPYFILPVVLALSNFINIEVCMKFYESFLPSHLICSLFCFQAISEALFAILYNNFLHCISAPCHQAPGTNQSSACHDKYFQDFDSWYGVCGSTTTSCKSRLVSSYNIDIIKHTLNHALCK